MILTKLNVMNFRNHKSTFCEFSEKLNVLFGLNGSGKTSILEAISIACFSKSFLPTSDPNLIQSNEAFYNVNLQAKTDLSSDYKVSVKYDSNSKKIISNSYQDSCLAKDLIGAIPAVILSPDYKSITFGTPTDRREFLDKALSILSKRYLDEYIQFKKALKNRNSLLSTAKKDRFFDYALLAPWTNIFVEKSAELIFRRYQYLKELEPLFKHYYKIVSSANEEVAIKYVLPYIKDTLFENEMTKNDLLEYMKDIAKNSIKEEVFRGVTIFGPQKDDIKFLINDRNARDSASQGQHKSLLISLKLAELDYLKHNKNENPIVLLDDIFSELDEFRSQKIIEILYELKNQIFITTAEKSKIETLIPNYKGASFFEVSKGEIISTF
jgi:DNA replication and repair protein RecF